MVEQLKSIFGFENLSEKQIQSTLESITTKHPYFHLARLFLLQFNKTRSTNQKHLSQVAVNTYQRRLLKAWLEKDLNQDNKSTESKKESAKSKPIDELINISDTDKVIRPNPNSSVYGKSDLSKKRLLQSNEVFTETLAELYLKQHQYQKALEVLTFLKSTDSKKSDYFATRIKEVQKQQKESHLHS
ncbi:MAG: hypothetical protein OXE77_10375 [Flavobacteriaceae bacterium]|nr:hypothetical protein [Flavobacteriaceae bacterium]MCY4267711.1 hypothetical protein [Flavobacteriaceae bacterium]MCY4299100.1 hypothetical protein [Flavobacteriaceae bacterium]